MAKPLNHLLLNPENVEGKPTKKKTFIQWTDIHQKAFDILKIWCTQTPC